MYTEVVTLHEGGSLLPAFSAAGIPVRTAGRNRKSLGAMALRRLVKWAREFDVVHTHLWAGDVYGRTAAWLAETPVRISTEHNVDRDEPRWKSNLKDGTSSMPHCVVAVSAAVQRHLGERNVRNTVMIHNGIDIDRFAQSWKGLGHKRIVAIGRLEYQKGFDVLLRAVSNMREVTLDLVGVGSEEERLRQLAPKTARFLGERDDIPALLSRASVLVVPSRWEGFGLVALEGMAAGTPVIYSNVDGLTEVIGAAGVPVEPSDPPVLAGAIRTVLASQSLQRELSQLGLARSKDFSVDLMVRRYEDLYRRIFDARHPISA